MDTRFSRLGLAAVATLAVSTWGLGLPAQAAPAATPSVPATSEATALKPDGALVETGEGLRIDWTRGVVSLTGFGFAPDRGSLSMRRSHAQQTALSDGARRLHETLARLRVNGNAYVRDLTAVDEPLRGALHSWVVTTPARTVKPWPDGSVEATLELPLWGEGSLSSLMARAVDLPAATGSIASDPSALVVDGRGTGSQPALAISLKDEAGKLLYHGRVTYFHLPESLSDVAGPKPLTLKARRAIGVTRADLTLAPDEARRFREARDRQPDLTVVVLL